ncbi:MAG: hypothetical protein COC21_02315 [Verrucomicrobiales bacterium]|nr:MAG: hypothetical protein COC21_02315 [Verrucomicrobiales bacterium]
MAVVQHRDRLAEIKKLLPIQADKTLEPYRHVCDATAVRRRQPRRRKTHVVRLAVLILLD